MNHSDKPLISIVTPSYNQGSFIEETIKSVLSQDYPRIDYIVIDGGSTDNTCEILKRYNGKLRWVSEPDKGQSDAIDKGFRMADGEILAWLNSDDTYLPGTLSKVMEVFCSRSDLNIVYGEVHFTDAGGDIMGRYPTEVFNYKRLAAFNFICQPGTFFRKEAFHAAGGVNIDLHYSMDYDLWIRMSKKYIFYQLPEFLATFRLHDESKTISPAAAIANSEETLMTVLKYYKWAPINRVYGSCFNHLKFRFRRLSRVKPVLIILSILYSVIRYMRLNKRIRMDDLRMIKGNNLGKLFKEQIDIFKEY